MGFLRRRVSAEARRQYDADRELADRYAELRAGAAHAERELHDAQARLRPLAEIRVRGESFDHELGAALKAALAGERAAMGVKAYDDRIERRRARVRPEVRRWTAEVSMLRSARENYRLDSMSSTGTLLPSHVRMGSHAMSSPTVPGAEPGLPDDTAEGAGMEEPRVGVDLEKTVGERPAHT